MKIEKSMKGYIKFNLTDLPIHEFVVLLKPEVQKKLINDSANKIAKQTKNFGKYKKLAVYLHKKCKSFENIKPTSLWNNYLFNWKNSKSYIPFDCVLELYKLINKKLNKRDILYIKYKISPNKGGVKFPFVYDEDLAFLGEAIRVEGHIKKDLTQTSISNKNLIFLRKIKKIFKKYIPTNSFYENLYLKIDIPKNKKVIKVKNNNKELNFNVYNDISNKTKLIFYDNANKLNKGYTIFFSDNSKIYVKIKEEKGELISISNYKVATGVLNLVVCNITFAKLLHYLLKIPPGKKTDLIFIPKVLKNSPQSVKIEAINAVLDSESWIRNNRIRVSLNSLKYLKELKEIFLDLGIETSLENKRQTLSINSVKELQKVASYFKFTLNRKDKLLKNNLKKEISLKKGESIKLISTVLKNKKSLTNKQLSIYRERHLDTIYKQLLKAIEIGIIERDINCWPYRYSLTQKGLEFLE